MICEINHKHFTFSQKKQRKKIKFIELHNKRFDTML